MEVETSSAAPVVVDSPLPVETLAAEVDPSTPSPLEAFFPKTEADPSRPFTPAITPEPAKPTTPAVIETSEAEKVKQLSEASNFDLSRFPDLKSAEAALSMMVENFAQVGLQNDGEDDSLFNMAKVPAPVVAPVESDGLTGLDETAVDPKVLAIIKGLQTKMQGFESAQQAQKKQQEAQVWQQIGDRAEAVLESLDSPVYGKNGSRNAMQKIATENLARLTRATLFGMVKTPGYKVPKIEQVMQMVLAKAGTPMGAKAAAPTAATPAQPFTLQPKQPQTAGMSMPTKLPRISKRNDPYGEMDDPAARAMYLEAMNR